MDFDKAPESEEERLELMSAILAQLRELGAARDVEVTCPCGHPAPMIFAYHCYFCGLWFCRRCAARHFGDPLTP